MYTAPGPSYSPLNTAAPCTSTHLHKWIDESLGQGQKSTKSRFSDPLKRRKRGVTRLNVRMISVWFPEAAVTPTSRVHFPPAHPHLNYHLSCRQQAQTGLLYLVLQSLWTAARQKGWDPHAGGAEEQNRACCSPCQGCTQAFLPGKWAGKSGQERSKCWCTLMPVLGRDWGVHPPARRSSAALWVHRLRRSLRELTGAMHSTEISLESSVGPK